MQNFELSVILNGLSKFAQNFTVRFLKNCFILSQSPLLVGETSTLIFINQNNDGVEIFMNTFFFFSHFCDHMPGIIMAH